MATLKVKKVKNYEYFYWSKSVRSHKKFGGDGRVRTVDHLIGSHPLGNWLAYRLWAGEAQLTEYAESVIQWVCPKAWENIVKVSIDWKRHRVSIRSSIPLLVDCRGRTWKREREVLQNWLNQIIKVSAWIDQIIERGAYYLALHNQYMADSQKLRDTAQDARLKPDKYEPEADLYLDEYASGLESDADRFIQHYLEIANDKLRVFVPPRQWAEFRVVAISRIERLAKNRQWLEQYRAEFEGS
jgi:hypothetical protein